MGVIARHQLRQMLGQRRLWLLVVFLVLPVAIVLLTHGQASATGYGFMLYVLYPQSVCILLALLYGSAVISSELESETLTYLFTRPIPRWQVIIGKYIATTLVLLVSVNVSFVAAWVATGTDAGASLFAALGLATSFSIVAYSAVYTMLGVFVPHKALVFGVLFAAVEFVLSLVPAIINTLTIVYYVRSLAFAEIISLDQMSNDDAALANTISRVMGDASTLEAIGALLLGTAICLGIACYTVTKRAYIEHMDI